MVDEATKQPIEGAVVVAVWETYGGILHQGVTGNLHTQEVVADDKGHFKLDVWGPKFVLWDALHGTAPRLIAFQRDYYFWIAGSDDPRSLAPPPSFTNEARGSSWSGKTIALKSFDGDWDEYDLNADIAEMNLHSFSTSWGLSCLWERMPWLTRELIRRGHELDDRRISHSLPREKALGQDGYCEDPKRVLEKYQ